MVAHRSPFAHLGVSMTNPVGDPFPEGLRSCRNETAILPSTDVPQPGKHHPQLPNPANPNVHKLLCSYMPVSFSAQNFDLFGSLKSTKALVMPQKLD